MCTQSCCKRKWNVGDRQCAVSHKIWDDSKYNKKENLKHHNSLCLENTEEILIEVLHQIFEEKHHCSRTKKGSLLLHVLLCKIPSMRKKFVSGFCSLWRYYVVAAQCAVENSGDLQKGASTNHIAIKQRISIYFFAWKTLFWRLTTYIHSRTAKARLMSQGDRYCTLFKDMHKITMPVWSLILSTHSQLQSSTVEGLIFIRNGRIRKFWIQKGNPWQSLGWTKKEQKFI